MKRHLVKFNLPTAALPESGGKGRLFSVMSHSNKSGLHLACPASGRHCLNKKHMRYYYSLIWRKCASFEVDIVCA